MSRYEGGICRVGGDAMAWSVGAGLEGKGVMITGAAGGIGREGAKAFASTGARLMVVDVNRDASEGILKEREGPGHLPAASKRTDLSTDDPLVRRARTELVSLYVLAHLAVVLRRRSSVDDVTEEDW